MYLWYDSAATDQLASYILGRGDDWHGTGYAAFSYDAANAAYAVDTNDNYTGSMRRQVNERDAYIEAEFYHMGCYPTDMTTGLLGRYVLNSGPVQPKNRCIIMPRTVPTRPRAALGTGLMVTS